MLLSLLKANLINKFLMPTSNDGIMVILSSPSGAGKTTLVNLLSKQENFEVSISHTTRERRRVNETQKIRIIILWKVNKQFKSLSQK